MPRSTQIELTIKSKGLICNYFIKWNTQYKRILWILLVRSRKKKQIQANCISRLSHSFLAIPNKTTTTTAMRPAPSSSTSTTVLESLTRQQQQTLTLRLNRPKKKVSWKEGTVDNEYMQKKSSKICCIFHKEKPFDEDDSDDDDDCNHDHKSDGACSSS